jgi:hypothetical protein
MENIEEQINENVTEKTDISIEIKDIPEEEILDKSIQSGKPKKQRTQKQIEAFEKARKTRAENVKKRKEDKKNNTKPVGRPKKKEPEIIEDNEAKEIIEEPEIESDSDYEEEKIVYKKKPKVKVKAKKKKPIKKKVVYISESESESEISSESEEEEIVKTILKKKKKKVQYYDPQDYEEEQYVYKPMSLTDFYKIA